MARTRAKYHGDNATYDVEIVGRGHGPGSVKVHIVAPLPLNSSIPLGATVVVPSRKVVI